MCYWGCATAGKILNDDEHYAGEYKIKVINDKLRNKIIDVITTYNWNASLNTISSKKLPIWQIIKVLKDKIPEIK